jgi:hypothetical protein
LRGFEIETPIAPASMPTQAVVKGNRNESLFEQCMREAHHCGDFDALLDVAHTRNALYEPPMSDQEVENIAKSAWNYTERGENRFGQTGAWLPTAEVNSMVGSNQDALLLLMFLRANNGPRRTFMVANGLAKILRWGLNRFRAARRHLEKTHIAMVVPPSTYNGPADYRWRSHLIEDLFDGEEEKKEKVLVEDRWSIQTTFVQRHMHHQQPSSRAVQSSAESKARFGMIVRVPDRPRC